jgi:hypothetical protein
MLSTVTALTLIFLDFIFKSTQPNSKLREHGNILRIEQDGIKQLRAPEGATFTN